MLSGRSISEACNSKPAAANAASAPTDPTKASSRPTDAPYPRFAIGWNKSGHGIKPAFIRARWQSVRSTSVSAIACAGHANFKGLGCCRSRLRLTVDPCRERARRSGRRAARRSHQPVCGAERHAHAEGPSRSRKSRLGGWTFELPTMRGTTARLQRSRPAGDARRAV